MGETVPHVINDLINVECYFFPPPLEEGLKTKVIVRMSVFYFLLSFSTLVMGAFLNI